LEAEKNSTGSGALHSVLDGSDPPVAETYLVGVPPHGNSMFVQRIDDGIDNGEIATVIGNKDIEATRVGDLHSSGMALCTSHRTSELSLL